MSKGLPPDEFYAQFENEGHYRKEGSSGLMNQPGFRAHQGPAINLHPHSIIHRKLGGEVVDRALRIVSKKR